MLYVSKLLEVVFALDETYSNKLCCNFLRQDKLNCFVHCLTVSWKWDPADQFEFGLDFRVEDDDIANDGFVFIFMVNWRTKDLWQLIRFTGFVNLFYCLASVNNFKNFRLSVILEIVCMRNDGDSLCRTCKSFAKGEYNPIKQKHQVICCSNLFFRFNFNIVWEALISEVLDHLGIKHIMSQCRDLNLFMITKDWIFKTLKALLDCKTYILNCWYFNLISNGLYDKRKLIALTRYPLYPLFIKS